MSDQEQTDRPDTDPAAGSGAGSMGSPGDSVPSAEPNHGPGAAVAHASRHENPSDQAESLGTGLSDHATGDIVIDSALQDLRDAPTDDLDAQIDAGQRVQHTLQARLSDLGGE